MEAAKARVKNVVSPGYTVFPVPVEQVEKRVFELKDRLAWLAWKSRDVKVVAATSKLLVSLTELLEDLEEGASPAEVLPRLSVLEAEAESLLSRPELARNSS